MNKKHIFLSVVSLTLLSACSLFPQEKKVIEVVSPLSPFDESLQLDAEYISHFRLDGLSQPGEESKYLVEKKKLLDQYNAGNRSINVLRAYIYLASLE